MQEFLKLPEHSKEVIEGLVEPATDNRRNAPSTMGLFRGCSDSITFKLPYLQDPQVAPTTGLLYAQGGQAVYTTHRPDGYPFRDKECLLVNGPPK